MEFKILGPLEMGTGGRSHAPTAPMPRQVLALLALRANQVVSTQLLTDELWPESPPASVATTLQTYVYQLRKKLSEPTVIGSGWGTVQIMERPEIITRSPGYVLLTPPEKVDVHRFDRLSDQGAKARKDGVLESAVATPLKGRRGSCGRPCPGRHAIARSGPGRAGRVSVRPRA